MWFSNKETKRVEGVDLINNVIDQFSKMIDYLEKGSNDCQMNCTMINVQIESLNERYSLLRRSSCSAIKIAAKLKELIEEERGQM